MYEDDGDCVRSKRLTVQKKLVILMNITGALYEAGFTDLAVAVNAEATKLLGEK